MIMVDGQKEEIVITEAMIEAGMLAFEEWVAGGYDEGAVVELPGSPSISRLSASMFFSMLSIMPEDTIKSRNP